MKRNIATLSLLTMMATLVMFSTGNLPVPELYLEPNEYLSRSFPTTLILIFYMVLGYALPWMIFGASVLIKRHFFFEGKFSSQLANRSVKSLAAKIAIFFIGLVSIILMRGLSKAAASMF